MYLEMATLHINNGLVIKICSQKMETFRNSAVLKKNIIFVYNRYDEKTTFFNTTCACNTRV